MSKLRLATPVDIPSMHAVRLAVRENRLSDPARISQADYLSAMTERGRTWVVEADGKIAGFASGYYDGRVWALFVHPDYESHGYGRALFATMVEWLSGLGLATLWLTTAPGTRAERFYVAQGWRPCGLEPNGDLRLELHV